MICIYLESTIHYVKCTKFDYFRSFVVIFRWRGNLFLLASTCVTFSKKLSGAWNVPENLLSLCCIMSQNGHKHFENLELSRANWKETEICIINERGDHKKRYSFGIKKGKEGWTAESTYYFAETFFNN